MRRSAGGRAVLAGALLAGGLLAGCAGGGVGGPRAATSGMSGAAAAGSADVGFVRRVAPFPVLDAEGVPYPHPFLGGFNLPRPQLVDIDGDGDADLFLQEVSGSVMLFENVGGGRFEWRTDRYQELEVGEWYRFVDFDRDGDPDLLAEEPFSYVRYYRNDGSPTEARFTLAADSLRDADGVPLFSDRQNILNATDIDCDGRMDLFIGRLVGTISRYEESGVTPDGLPVFRHLTDRFEDIEIVAQFGSLHGANTMAWGDVDGDGDEDLFWGDYFEAGLLLIENQGTCRSPSLRGTPRPFPLDAPLRTSGYMAPTVGDVDGDGAPDVLAGVLGGAYNPNTTTVENLHFLRQGADGSFRDETGRFVPTVDVGSESVPVLVDLDGDGDLDLLVGNKIEPDDPRNGKLYRFVNEGSRRAPVFREAGVSEVGGGYHFVPAFGDLDGDGDLDAVLGTWQDELRYLRNDGEGGAVELTPVEGPFLTLTRGRNATPALGDVDGDGDLDLLVGESSGTVNFYRNDGTPTAPDFTLVSDEFAGVDVGRRSFPVLEDLDRDGDLDLLVGSESGGVFLYRNLGTSTVPDFVADPGFHVPHFGLAAPAFGDLDGDGDRDVLLGGVGGGLWYLERVGR
ncbi:MAG: VCBS repeat-containing protein [Gemmatimonadota bacterium]|nr:VCBS repeat-containing protein [Gemmatimonadota bacterium]